jgi:dTDP-4-amino-4,6-dideoxygalactose transaminase
VSAAPAKSGIADLAIFGGSVSFPRPISTSNLVRPDFRRFLDYSRVFYEQHRYTNDGPLVKLLEHRLAEFHQVRYCIAVANGFWALVLSIKALALRGRDEVLMPSLTYRRLADVVAWTGLKPRFCEVDANSLAIDTAAVDGMVDARTALILGVHPIVNTCDAPGLCRVAEDHGVPLLFDAVESVYETIGGRKVGTFGDAECFSMHASKLINGFEGGYVTTNNAELAHRLAVMRGFGFFGHDSVEMLGLNAKLSEVHAAMALAGLDDLEDQVARNRGRYRLYQQLLQDIPGVRLLEFDESERASYKNIVVELGGEWPLSRDLTIRVLNEDGALVRAYYSPPLHAKPMAYPHVPAVLPLTDRLATRFMLLPCGHMVDHDDIRRFVELLAFIRAHASEIQAAEVG